MRIPFYGIYEINSGRLEVYNLNNGFYQQLLPNDRGHYPIAPMGVELGLWQGSYQNQTMLWLRWWDSEGNLLLTGTERASLAEQALSAEAQARRDAIPRLLSMGLNTQQVAEALGLSVEEVSQHSQS